MLGLTLGLALAGCADPGAGAGWLGRAWGPSEVAAAPTLEDPDAGPDPSGGEDGGALEEEAIEGVGAARLGGWSLEGWPNRHSALELLPSEPPSLSVYEDFGGYTDHPLWGALRPLDGAPPTDGARLLHELVLGALGGRGLVTIYTGAGAFLSRTGWGGLGEYEIPAGATTLERHPLRISSGREVAAALFPHAPSGGPRGYGIAAIEDEGGGLRMEERWLGAEGACVASLSAVEGRRGHCWAWATYDGTIELARRCDPLGASLGDFEPEPEPLTLTLAPAPVRYDEQSLFVSRGGEVLLQAADAGGPLNILWAPDRSAPYQPAAVVLPGVGPIRSVAQVGELLLAVIGERPSEQRLYAVALPAEAGWVRGRWRLLRVAPFEGDAPGRPLGCDGAARLLERLDGGAWLTCQEDGRGEVGLLLLEAQGL